MRTFILSKWRTISASMAAALGTIEAGALAALAFVLVQAFGRVAAWL